MKYLFIIFITFSIVSCYDIKDEVSDTIINVGVNSYKIGFMHGVLISQELHIRLLRGEDFDFDTEIDTALTAGAADYRDILENAE